MTPLLSTFNLKSAGKRPENSPYTKMDVEGIVRKPQLFPWLFITTCGFNKQEIILT